MHVISFLQLSLLFLLIASVACKLSIILSDEFFHIKHSSNAINLYENKV